MLAVIREKAQGWFAWVIVVLISIPFALFGIQQYLGGGGEAIVATVNGTEITQRTLDNRMQSFRANIRNQLGDAYKPGMLDDEKLKEEMLNSLIRSRLVLDASDKLGLRISDFEVVQFIRNFPAFQVAGKFNQTAYEQGVRVQGMSQQGFEVRVRDSLVSNQLSRAIASSAFMMPFELAEFAKLNDQRRDISFITVSADDLADSASVTDEQIKQYYDTHLAEFEIPEQVKIEYVMLDRDELAKDVVVTDDDLKTYFEAHVGDYTRAEKRTIRHILIEVKDTDEAAREKADAIYKQLLEGADFAELAKQSSDDSGSSELGGNLGVLEPGTVDDAFDEVVAKLAKNEVSKPVKTEFGYHIIEVTDIQNGTTVTLDEIKDKVAAAYRKDEAERQYYEVAERFADLSYSQPDSLAPVSEELGLPIVESDWFNRSGGEGITANAKVTNAAFSEDVLDQGNNSEVIELNEGKSLVLRTVEHAEPSTKDLADVSVAIKDLLAATAASEKAFAKAQELQKQLDSGESLTALAEQTSLVYSAPGAIKRSDISLDSALVGSVFRMGRPAEGQSVSDVVKLGNGDAVLVQLHNVIDGDMANLDDAARKSATDTVVSVSGQALFDDYVDWLESKADIVK